MTDDPILQTVLPALAATPGVAAVVLGGSRARGTATAASDYDVGLYFQRSAPLDTAALGRALAAVVDDPPGAAVTAIGEWGPWIVGGGWLRVAGQKLDILYREVEAVEAVIDDARQGVISMNYQVGHPHGFCSAHWMGEVALCRPLHDPQGVVARLKGKTAPYPSALRDILVRRFGWEALFAIENGELAAARAEQSHVAGCAYRSLCCMAQTLYALNGRYLINEKGALSEAAGFPATLADLDRRVAAVWRDIGAGAYDAALAELRRLEGELRVLSPA